jgi:hypothetical protein
MIGKVKIALWFHDDYAGISHNNQPTDNSKSMPKGHGIALTPLKGAKLSFIEGKFES